MKLTDSQYKLFELGHFLLRVYYWNKSKDAMEKNKIRGF